MFTNKTQLMIIILVQWTYSVIFATQLTMLYLINREMKILCNFFFLNSVSFFNYIITYIFISATTTATNVYFLFYVFLFIIIVNYINWLTLQYPRLIYTMDIVWFYICSSTKYVQIIFFKISLFISAE